MRLQHAHGLGFKGLQSPDLPSFSPMPASKSSTKKRPKASKASSKASLSKQPRASSASDEDNPKKKHKGKPADDTSEDDSVSPVRTHHKQSKGKGKAKPKARRPAPAIEEVEEDVEMVSEPEVIVEEGSDKSSQVSVSFKL